MHTHCPPFHICDMMCWILINNKLTQNIICTNNKLEQRTTKRNEKKKCRSSVRVYLFIQCRMKLLDRVINLRSSQYVMYHKHSHSFVWRFLRIFLSRSLAHSLALTQTHTLFICFTAKLIDHRTQQPKHKKFLEIDDREMANWTKYIIITCEQWIHLVALH